VVTATSSLKRWVSKLVVVVHTCDPSIGRLRKEDQEFKASLGYIARPYLKKKKKKKWGNLRNLGFHSTPWRLLPFYLILKS
jgi:hypothetical protein